MIRQFRIRLDFLQHFCVHSRPLARSAAHQQLRVLRGLKHGTGQPLCCVPCQIQTFLQNLVLVAEYCSDVCYDEFQVPQIDRK